MVVKIIRKFQDVACKWYKIQSKKFNIKMLETSKKEYKFIKPQNWFNLKLSIKFYSSAKDFLRFYKNFMRTPFISSFINCIKS